MYKKWWEWLFLTVGAVSDIRSVKRSAIFLKMPKLNHIKIVNIFFY